MCALTGWFGKSPLVVFFLLLTEVARKTEPSLLVFA